MIYLVLGYDHHDGYTILHMGTDKLKAQAVYDKTNPKQESGEGSWCGYREEIVFKGIEDGTTERWDILNLDNDIARKE